jgi:uncharacterized protein DUF3499
MAEDARTCRRIGCNETAVASLSFRYETRQVWVTAPMRDGKGTRYDLCAGHADSLTVPRGWHRVDEREAIKKKTKADSRPPTPSPRLIRGATAPPPERPPADRTPPPGPVTAEGVQDRYARLLSELPQLAEQVPLLLGHDAGAAIAGQLAIPVPDQGQPEAVIVSLTDLAGARRDRETLGS